MFGTLSSWSDVAFTGEVSRGMEKAQNHRSLWPWAGRTDGGACDGQAGDEATEDILRGQQREVRRASGSFCFLCRSSAVPPTGPSRGGAGGGCKASSRGQEGLGLRANRLRTDTTWSVS